MGELLPEISQASSSGHSFPSLLNASLDELVDGLKSSRFSSVDLVRAYFARVEEVNEAVHAVVETNPDALDIARSLDEERASGSIRGPLHGIPVLIKNNISTHDKMDTTSGSQLLIGATVPRDAFVAQKLREAGAVILGKTNMSQWANYRARDYKINGWSSHGGQTLAAYHSNQNPSGSSSGSGVAADLGLAWAALGSETDGSIISPAQKSGIVGIKPTVGLTSRALVIPISEHQDTVGPMARTVKDAAYLLQAIVGEDPHDKYTAAIPGIGDYVAACKDTLAGARIGVPWKTIEQELKTNAHLASEVQVFREALAILEAAGATIIEANYDSSVTEIRDAEKVIMRADFLANVASYLAQLSSNPSNIHTLADIREQTQKHPLESYPKRDTGIWDDILSEQRWDNTDPQFQPAYELLQKLGGPGGLSGVLERHDLTAVVMPTSMASMWAAVIGAPAVTVPMGHHPDSEPVHEDGDMVETGPGVPIGLSFLGAKWSEETLIGLAFGFEQRTKVRDRPVKRVAVPKTEL